MKVLTKLMQEELSKQHRLSLHWTYCTEGAKVVARLQDRGTGAVWYALEGYRCEKGWQLFCYADSDGSGNYEYEYLTIPDLCDTSITRDIQYEPERVADAVRRLG